MGRNDPGGIHYFCPLHFYYLIIPLPNITATITITPDTLSLAITQHFYSISDSINYYYLHYLYEGPDKVSLHQSYCHRSTLIQSFFQQNLAVVENVMN